MLFALPLQLPVVEGNSFAGLQVPAQTGGNGAGTDGFVIQFPGGCFQAGHRGGINAVCLCLFPGLVNLLLVFPGPGQVLAEGLLSLFRLAQILLQPLPDFLLASKLQL